MIVVKFDSEHDEFLQPTLQNLLSEISSHLKKFETGFDKNVAALEMAVNLSIALILNVASISVKKEGMAEVLQDVLDEIEDNFNRLINADLQQVTVN